MRSRLRALDLCEPIARAQPTVLLHQHNLGIILNNLGMNQRSLGQLDPARVSAERSVAILEKLVKDHPETRIYHQSLAGALTDLGLLRMAQGRRLEALGLMQRALSHQKEQWTRNPRDPYFKESLSELPGALKTLIRPAPAPQNEGK